MFVGGLDTPNDALDSLKACSAWSGASEDRYTASGSTWFDGTFFQTCYNHAIGPNSTIPDCVIEGYYPKMGHFAARSNHLGGVHSAMADGSVRFVSDSISLNVWMAIGSRAGGEVVSGDSW